MDSRPWQVRPLQSEAVDAVLYMLEASDSRVRDQAAKTFASMCRHLHFPSDQLPRKPVDTFAARYGSRFPTCMQES